ncbi:hypothetical protein M422DRAFT_49183 [Sphaerobolus stellatus SS14]|uniref:Uncharacterized protein n=1 Tax=Sphaerobolus stellatus (strain SS14) TaxID=990650 RepID=A0A0C9UZB8_SPHS4|nr:hypothetical protein M422DRAFT_49183 [Sphaerobolus stellatus SS14]
MRNDTARNLYTFWALVHKAQRGAPISQYNYYVISFLEGKPSIKWLVHIAFWLCLGKVSFIFIYVWLLTWDFFVPNTETTLCSQVPSAKHSTFIVSGAYVAFTFSIHRDVTVTVTSTQLSHNFISLILFLRTTL